MNATVLLVNVAKAGAVLLAIVALFGFVVAVYGRLWPSAAIFGAGTIPPLWFLWHNRGPERRRRARRERSDASRPAGADRRAAKRRAGAGGE